jgi:hypothetical protein
MRDLSMLNIKDLMLEVLGEYTDAAKWNSSKFEKIKRVSNSKVGEIGQGFIQRLCEAYKLQYEFPSNSKGKQAKQNPWDIKIEGVTFELKTATEDTGGAFQFNHFRYHRTYDAVLCLGIAPDEVYFNVWSKADLATGKAGKLVSMEKSANASYKLTKRPVGLLAIDIFQNRIIEFIKEFKKQ